jgi:hypothetical protein
LEEDLGIMDQEDSDHHRIDGRIRSLDIMAKKELQPKNHEIITMTKETGLRKT